MLARALISTLVFLGLAACDRGPSRSPQQFALDVAATVARNDWAGYRPLALAPAVTLATDSNPTATWGTFASLTDDDAERIRRDFDRVVRAGVLRSRDLSGYEAVVDATEPDRWHVHIQDTHGPTGLRMTLQRSGDSYRVVHLYTR